MNVDLKIKKDQKVLIEEVNQRIINQTVYINIDSVQVKILEEISIKLQSNIRQVKGQSKLIDE